MSAQDITTNDLRRMKKTEGLVFTGCGGDPQEWIDGINGELTSAGILLQGSKFNNVFRFQHDGVTCLLFRNRSTTTPSPKTQALSKTPRA